MNVREKIRAERDAQRAARTQADGGNTLSDRDILNAISGLDDTGIAQWAESAWHGNQTLRRDFISAEVLSAYCRALNKRLITNAGVI